MKPPSRPSWQTGRGRWSDLLIRTSGEYRIAFPALAELAYAENPTSPMCSWPRFQRAGPGGRPCLDFQNRQRRFAVVHKPRPLRRSLPPTSPFHVPLESPPPPPHRRCQPPLTGRIRPCRFPLRHNWEPQEIEDLPAATPLLELLLATAQQVHRAANPGLSGSQLASPAEPSRQAAAKKTGAYCPNRCTTKRRCQRSPGAGGGSRCWSGPAAARPRRPCFAWLGLGATIRDGAPRFTPCCHGAGCGALGLEACVTP